MEKFLQIYPEYKEKESTIRAIRNKVIFKKIKPLNDQLSIFKVAMIKKMLSDEFYRNPKLLGSYRDIVKNEKNEVEKAVFQLLSAKPVVFKDLSLKFLFYKEFPEKFDFFLNGDEEPYTVIADLLFKKIYMKIDVQSELKAAVLNLSFKDTIFYIIALSDEIDVDFRKEILMKVKAKIEHERCAIKEDKKVPSNTKNSTTDSLVSKSVKSNTEISSMRSISNESHYSKKQEDLNENHKEKSNPVLLWCLGLRSLPSEEYYNIISHELLFSTYIEKLILFRAISEITDIKKLSIVMLKESMNDLSSLVKMYILYLKVIELFNLEYSFKLQILYTWLRFFLVQNKLDLFDGLMLNLSKSKKLSLEYEIYVMIKRLYSKEISLEQFNKEMSLFEDKNSIGIISKEDMIDSVLKYYKTSL